jgi:1-acyl-sn-glycerol-3-phosphate acyltransferase
MVPRSAEPYVPSRESSTFPTEWARGPAANTTREVIQVAGLSPLLRHVVRPAVGGLDVLDGLTGPVVFVANHTSHLDTPLILCSLPDRWRRRTAVAAAADYFFDTWWRATGSALVFNTFPIERRGGALSATPGDLLRDGWSVVIFPEGTRSPDGWPRRFKVGAAYVAAETGVPVVPVAIRGSYAAMPRGRNWPVPGRPPVTVRFGPPVRPEPGTGARELAPLIEQAVARLVDEDASSWWDAARRAARDGSTAQVPPADAGWRRVWESTAPPRVRRHRRVWR